MEDLQKATHVLEAATVGILTAAIGFVGSADVLISVTCGLVVAGISFRVSLLVEHVDFLERSVFALKKRLKVLNDHALSQYEKISDISPDDKE